MSESTQRPPALEKEEKRPRSGTQRKPYQKPAFCHERVFETMALSCGKVATEWQCKSLIKNS